MQCLGCEAACPSTVPFGHLIEGANQALASTPTGPRRPRRASRRVRASGSGSRVVLPRHRLLLAVTWLLLVGQRLHLVPRRFGAATAAARSLRTPLIADPAPTDAYLFPAA